MKQKIKSPASDTLKGTGINKLRFETNKVHSTVKRMISSFDDQTITSSTKKNEHKIKSKCPNCKRNFWVKEGKKIPKHKTWYGTDCSSKPFTPPSPVKYFPSTIINEVEYKKGETVIFIPYPNHHLFNVDRNDIIKTEISEICLMDNDTLYFKFKNFDRYFPTYYFLGSKNFIKDEEKSN